MKPTHLLLALALLTPSLRAAESPADRDARMQWWRDARLGLSVHVGLYSIPAGRWNDRKIPGPGEWIQSAARVPVADYEKLAARFNPAKFDAREWVALARRAGAKYLVVTAKHHDGFCLWPSKVSDFTVARTPFGRDLLKELADACRADGTVRFCVYYSIMDWHHPDAQAPAAPTYNPANGYAPNPDFPRYLERYLKPQIKELVESYNPGVLWFDGEWIPEYTPAHASDLDAYCRQLDPKIILNNRVGTSRKGTAGPGADPGPPGDFGTPEHETAATGLPPGVDFESRLTINDTWGYKADDARWKSAQTLVRHLVDAAGKGGNCLLNVGPTADGEVPAEAVKRLEQVGAWMNANGHAVHGTTAAPFKKWTWGRATAGRDGTLHVFPFVWPNGDDLVLPLRNAAAAVAGAGGFTATARADGLHLAGLPEKSPDPLVPRISLKLDGPPNPIDPAPVRQQPDGTLTLRAADCDVHATNARLEKKGKNPANIGYWTNLQDHVTWDAVVDRPVTFAITLDYSLGGPAPGSEIRIEFGDDPAKVIPVPLAPGKDFLDFRTIPLGQVTLPQGPLRITVRPVKKAGVAVMDLRTITLKPAQ